MTADLHAAVADWKPTPLDTLGKTIKTQIGKADDMMISAGANLIEARGRVASGEAGDTTWALWLEEHQIGTEKAKVCLRIANDPDPEQALAIYREQRRAVNARHYETKTSGSLKTSSQSVPVTTRNEGPFEPVSPSPWLADMVARWRTGTPSEQAAFLQHIGGSVS